jgi:hypothetical protein
MTAAALVVAGVAAADIGGHPDTPGAGFTRDAAAARRTLLDPAEPAAEWPQTSRPPRSSFTRGRPVEIQRWRRVLAALDRIRGMAWLRGEPRLLRRVYSAASTPLDHDREMLASYTRRGLRVRGVRLHIDRLHVLSRAAGRVRLLVIDQLGPATAVSRPGYPRRLPTDRPSRHLVVLRRTEAGWRIAAVRG